MTDTTECDVPEFGDAIRREFMLKPDIAFLNHGSYGGIPECVHERQIQYLREMESHTDFWFRFNYPHYLQTALDKVAEFVGAKAEDIVLVQNVTKAVNNVVKMYPLRQGDAILLTTLTYGAVKSTATAATERVTGTEVLYLEITFPIKCEDDIVEQYEAFLQAHPQIKLAVIDHITSPTSVVLPVRRLVDVCHQHDVITMIDGAHVPGQINVDLQSIDADFYTGNLHKWVYTPKSCAFLWINPTRSHDWFKPLVTSAYEKQGLNKAFSYEGTLDSTAYLCAIDGINFYNRIGGMNKILSYTRDLKERGVAYLENTWQTQRLDIPATMEAPNIHMIRLPPLPKYAKLTNIEVLRVFVERFGVQVAFEYVEGEMLIRVSVQVYNTMADFVKLANAVLTLAGET